MPPANPFWSEKTQSEHALQFFRPEALDGHTAPIPPDEDLDDSPKPLQSSGQQGMPEQSQVTSFETPGSPRAEKPQDADEQEMEAEDGGCGDREASGMGITEEKKLDGMWNRRLQAGGSHVDESLEKTVKEEKHGRQLEEELAGEVLWHFQQETVSLQKQNDALVMELQRLKDEKVSQQALAVPPSWSHERAPTPPPRPSPGTHGTQQWMSPESCLLTPNGTRVPSGPPPPSPPELPSWPPMLANYEVVEPPRKLRGVMGDRVYQVGHGTCSPRTARSFWLEQEVAALKERLEQESFRSKQFQSSYWAKPFLTEEAKVKEVAESVECMRRQAGLDVPSMKHGSHVHGEQHHQDRARMEQATGQADAAFAAEHGDHRREARAGVSTAFVHGEHCQQARASTAFGHGGHLCASTAFFHGGHFQEGRACMASEHGEPRGGGRARASLEHGGHPQDDRACIAPEQSLGEVYQHDPTGTHGGARRWDRNTVEDGDLKSVPIQLPSLPLPEGRDASLEAGDWLVQLEPLVGDLSRNAAGWWKRVMQATTTTYAEWLHADPLSRLKVLPPNNGPLCAGYERLDQRMTSLLLQAVPKSIKS